MSDNSANIARHLDSMAKTQGGTPALYIPEYPPQGRFDFSQLRRAVDASAHYLNLKGIQPQMRTLLLVKPGADLIFTVFALFKIGAIPIVIDPGMGLKRFLRAVQHTQPEALVGIPKAQWIARLFPHVFKSLQVRASIGDRTYHQFIQHSSPFTCLSRARNDLAAILFTSGSTGPAKGVCYTHGMFEAQVNIIREHYGIEPGEVDLPMLPVFALFNPALGMATVVPEMNPARPASVDPERIVKAIKDYGVTNSFGSPAIWTKIAQHCLKNRIKLPSLRRILMAGAPVPPALVEDFQGILPNGHIHTPYGATEALPLCSIRDEDILHHAQATRQGRGTCVGRPIPPIRLRVIKPSSEPIDCYHSGLDCAIDEVGEIIASGPVVTATYDRLEDDATRKAKICRERIEDRSVEALWHKMGDVGYFDGTGQLWFCGRLAEIVQTTQGPLYTDCCEAIFNQHPHVARSALIGLGKAPAQEPAMVIEPYPNDWPSNRHAREIFIDELRALAQNAPHTALIQTFFFERSLPVDVRHNAKIHRLTLARKFTSQHKPR